VLAEVGSRISRSHPGCPWENGFQETFYGKFKLDFAEIPPAQRQLPTMEDLVGV
jgi:hypothetical protein